MMTRRTMAEIQNGDVEASNSTSDSAHKCVRLNSNAETCARLARVYTFQSAGVSTNATPPCRWSRQPLLFCMHVCVLVSDSLARYWLQNVCYGRCSTSIVACALCCSLCALLGATKCSLPRTVTCNNFIHIALTYTSHLSASVFVV